jgi:hypothetical protein
MSKYAVEISTGFVSQIIVGDYVWANKNIEGKWVDCTFNEQPCAGIGYVWDGTNFSVPPLPEV